MAIVIEEESRNGTHWGNRIAWLLVAVVLAVAVYYIFFKKPHLVEVATPDNFQNIEQISTLTKLDPNAIVNTKEFQILQSYATPLQPQSGGRINPFLSSF